MNEGSITLRITGKRWAVRLSGEWADLTAAREFFNSGRQTVLDSILPEPEAIVLQADEFEALDDPVEVRDAADRILAPMNAILYLEDPVRRPLAVWSVHKRADNGSWSIIFFPESASIRVRGVHARGQAGSFGAHTPPTPQSLWAETSLNNEVVADVLSHLRATPDWIALYKAFEVMRRDVDDRKSERGPLHGWPSNEQMRKFSRDAQLHRHSKVWCEKHGIVSSGAMSFIEASELVRSMTKIWIDWRM